jgi:hypothetical protein
VAAVNNIIRLSAVYASECSKEDDRREKELIGDPETVYQRE